MPDPLLHPEPTEAWLPVSYHHNAFIAFNEAYELDQLSHLINRLSIPQTTLSREANGQRKALLDIVKKIVEKERDSAMDRAAHLWSTYRTMRPSDDQGGLRSLSIEERCDDARG